jgi:mono/diheme cytochrome c family protein
MRRVAIGFPACIPACIMASIAIFATGCRPAPGHPPDPAPRPDQVMDFATLYHQNCAACHGRNGQNGPAIDLANPEYQALIDDAALRKWIASGMLGTEMPAFAMSAGGMLTDAQVDALITGMRKAWGAQNAFAGDVPPAYAETRAGDAKRGAMAYQQRCVGCHKASGQEIASRAYLALTGDQALRSIIVAGRPDLGQPDWRHDSPGGKSAAPLSTQDVDDIVTYLGTLRSGTPAKASAQGGR